MLIVHVLGENGRGIKRFDFKSHQKSMSISNISIKNHFRSISIFQSKINFMGEVAPTCGFSYNIVQISFGIADSVKFGVAVPGDIICLGQFRLIFTSALLSC